ncbi:MAG: hypothetical protein IMW88_05985 [Thermoflavifilum sp.]|uniref:DUF6048 family protein n=1 Tax=Thermoflavifilum sp. TaxID=1968839 RepID=UPI0018A53CC0|nr:DUF6048 family protein [Thermoflavifilum sp.]QOR74944.1 MAG: hypothetical protein IMW88_05985 [Thermoflavifilum sp.]
MKNIFVCFISLLIIQSGRAQQKTDSAIVAKDTSMAAQPAQHDSVIVVAHDLRLGIDLSRIAMPFLQPGRRDAEVSADMQIIPNWYGVVELGYHQMEINKPDLFQYQSHGYFYRIGVDKNILPPGQNNHRHDIAYFGFRLGHAVLQQTVSSYHITDTVWGNVDGSIPRQTIQGLWLEFVAGLKIQIATYVDLGWSVRGRTLLNHPEQKTNVPPYVIPGFGKGSSRQAFDFNYSLFFRIPIFNSHYTLHHNTSQHHTGNP